MDALIVGADLLMTMTAGKKTFEKKIFLFTDPNSSKPINTNGLDQIVSQLNDHQICLNVILLDDHVVETDTAGGNKQTLSEFCERVSDGAVYNVQEALGLLQQFMTRRVRQVATFRGLLTILPGDLEIPINLFTKTSIQRLPSAKKYSPYGKEGLERSLTYQQYPQEGPLEGGTSSTGKEELIKAYRYGRSLVPFHKIDEAQMGFKTSKSFQVLGFLSANQIERESFMSGVYAIVGEPGNASALRAISAIARALYEKDMVALVRYVRAENNPPKLGILQPRIKSSYESLLFNILPYSEDQRKYTFASFPARADSSADQDAIMKEWINGMDLMEAARDEDGNAMEALRPGDTFNITFQAHYSAVQNRALHPNAPLLPPDASLLAHLSTPQSLLDSNAQVFDRLTRAFPLRTRTLNQQQVSDQVSRLWTQTTNALPTKSFDSDDDEEEKTNNNSKRQLDPSNPIPDFLAMLNDKHQDLVENALMQLMELIPKFVEQSNIELAFECFRELRSAALKVKLIYSCPLH
jgi:ATP-dependent DNA helicase 2 subunit 2